MKSNVRFVKKCPPFKKEFISFDKKGKKVITEKEITDCYLVVLKDGSSVALNKEQMKMYGIIATLPDTKETITSNKPVIVDEIEEDLDEDNENEGEGETTVTDATPTLKLSTNSQVTNNNSPIVIK